MSVLFHSESDNLVFPGIFVKSDFPSIGNYMVQIYWEARRGYGDTDIDINHSGWLDKILSLTSFSGLCIIGKLRIEADSAVDFYGICLNRLIVRKGDDEWKCFWQPFRRL